VRYRNYSCYSRHQVRCCLWKNKHPKDDEEEVPVKKASLADALNCAEVLFEFLEKESDSNFSDILTLRKLRTSVELKRSKKTKQRF
jgi:hypothetical protein